MLSRNLLLECARSWIDTPYHHQARVKGVGVDCLGFVICAANEAGANIEDKPIFRQVRLSSHEFRRVHFHLESVGFISKQIRELGDILTMWRDPRSKRPFHLGFYAGETIIHVNSLMGKVVEEVLSFWEYRVTGIFQIPGVK